jgi:hypothetical protein
MFVARGMVVCLAFFAVMYAILSCLVSGAWRVTLPLQRRAWDSPGWLFGLRILPFAASALVAVFFTFPSFWLMERKSLDEDAMTFVLAACALGLAGWGMARACKAAQLTSRAIAHWSAKPDNPRQTDRAMLSAAAGAPALMLVGLRRPRIMVSDMATAVLSESELQVAVRHELAHKRAWDNLKKVLINATPFPGMHRLERAWREAAELAADDAAIGSRQDALDLAAALIKLSRSASRWSEPQIASALVCGSSAVDMRVRRLLQWRTRSQLQRVWPWALVALLAAAVAIANNYGTALAITHRLTELVVP